MPGAALLEGYGCTESGAVISSSTLDDRRSGSVGRPLPRFQVRVVDAAGRDVPAGRRGDLGTRARRHDRLLERPRDRPPTPLAEGWLHTGDVGHLDADGYL